MDIAACTIAATHCGVWGHITVGIVVGDVVGIVMRVVIAAAHVVCCFCSLLQHNTSVM